MLVAQYSEVSLANIYVQKLWVVVVPLYASYGGLLEEEEKILVMAWRREHWWLQGKVAMQWLRQLRKYYGKWVVSYYSANKRSTIKLWQHPVILHLKSILICIHSAACSSHLLKLQRHFISLVSVLGSPTTQHAMSPWAGWFVCTEEAEEHHAPVDESGWEQEKEEPAQGNTWGIKIMIDGLFLRLS